MGKRKSTGAGGVTTPGGDLATPAEAVLIEPIPAPRRVAVLLHHLQLIEQTGVAHEDTGRYSVLPVAIEGWLRTAIANAEQLLEELSRPPEKAPRKKAAARKTAKRAARGSAAGLPRTKRAGGRVVAADRPAGDDPYPGGEHGGPAD